MAGRNPENSSEHKPNLVFGKNYHEPIRPAFEVSHGFNPRRDLLDPRLNIKHKLDAITDDSAYIGMYTDMEKKIKEENKHLKDLKKIFSRGRRKQHK